MNMDKELCKTIRELYGMTSAEFSQYIGVGLSSLQQWESGYSNSMLIPTKLKETVPQSIITEAERILRLKNEIKAEAAL